DLGNNRIKEIQPGAFADLKSLEKLDLSNNQLKNIPENLFHGLVSLRYLKVDHFTLCCYAEKSNPGVTCISNESDGISSCDELLKNTVLKYCIWILGIMAFAGNLIVIIWRAIAKDVNRVNSFLLTNLAVADLLMGVYMLIIAYKNTEWDGVYFKHDFSWRDSYLCKFAGVISIVSSEVSVLTLTVITLDRLICIVFLFRFTRWSVKKASAIMFAVWILGFCISTTPLFYDAYFYNYELDVHFFGRSAVCLPFHLSNDRPSGWEYSVSLFIVLNGVSFLFILLAYASIYHTTVKSAKNVRVILLLRVSEFILSGLSNVYGSTHNREFQKY
ncbi:G- coupled receptor GRL101-like, partial [Paramuricea clavata]